nr:hypothetical protein [Roseomonas aerilata]
MHQIEICRFDGTTKLTLQDSALLPDPLGRHHRRELRVIAHLQDPCKDTRVTRRDVPGTVSAQRCGIAAKAVSLAEVPHNLQPSAPGKLHEAAGRRERVLCGRIELTFSRRNGVQDG